MAIFDQHAGLNQFNPQDDYETNLKRIQAQRALAQAMQQRLDVGGLAGGQNGGFYAGPGRTAVLANLLQNVMGAYTQGKAMEGDIANERQSKADYKAGRDLLFKDQGEYIDDAQRNALAYTHKNPEQVGPQMPEQPAPEAAQSFPVAPQPQIDAHSLPTMSPLARAVAASNPAGRVGTEKGRGTNTGDATFDPNNQAPGVRGVLANLRDNERRRNERHAAVPAAAAQPRPAAPVAPQAILPPPQSAQAAPVAPASPVAQVPAAPAAPEDTSPFNIDGAAQQRYLTRAVQADRLRAMELLDRSGERGVGLTRAIEAQMLGPKKDDYTTLKPGESLYRNGKLVVTGQGDNLEERKFRYQQEQDAKKEGKAATEAQGGVAAMLDFNSEIDRIQASKIPEDASSFTGTIGAGMNTLTGGALKTDGSKARAEFDGLKAKGKQAAIQTLQASGIPASQLANSNAEGEALVASVLNIDYSRMDAKQIRDELGRARSRIQEGLANIARKYGGRIPGAAGGSMISPGGIDWSK